jgi:hypothetical protein
MSNDNFDIENLRHPEDISQEVSVLEFVGYYIRVYMAYVRITWNFTQIAIKSGNAISTNVQKHMADTESKYEAWLANAEDYLPEWFDKKLLGYPEDSAFGDAI